MGVKVAVAVRVAVLVGVRVGVAVSVGVVVDEGVAVNVEVAVGAAMVTSSSPSGSAPAGVSLSWAAVPSSSRLPVCAEKAEIVLS